jgi:hypothetical protein
MANLILEIGAKGLVYLQEIPHVDFMSTEPY